MSAVVQCSRGLCDEVAVDAAHHVGAGVGRLRKRLSPKSAVILNRPGVAKQASEELAAAGVVIAVEGGPRISVLESAPCAAAA